MTRADIKLLISTINKFNLYEVRKGLEKEYGVENKRFNELSFFYELIGTLKEKLLRIIYPLKDKN